MTDLSMPEPITYFYTGAVLPKADISTNRKN